MDHERVSGDMNRVKFIIKDCANALKHLHRKGIVHGDFKPLNAVRVNGHWKLIDLDASAKFRKSSLRAACF